MMHVNLGVPHLQPIVSLAAGVLVLSGRNS